MHGWVREEVRAAVSYVNFVCEFVCLMQFAGPWSDLHSLAAVHVVLCSPQLIQ